MGRRPRHRSRATHRRHPGDAVFARLGHSRTSVGTADAEGLDYANPNRSQAAIRQHLQRLVEADIVEKVELPEERQEHADALEDIVDVPGIEVDTEIDLSDSGILERVTDTQPHRYRARRIDLHVGTDEDSYQITPALFVALARRETNENMITSPLQRRYVLCVLRVPFEWLGDAIPSESPAEFLVYPWWQAENNIVGSDGSFEQVDGVVSLEGDEQIRIDDVCLHVRKERVRHVDSLPTTFVDRRIQLVNVGGRFELGIDIQEYVTQLLQDRLGFEHGEGLLARHDPGIHSPLDVVTGVLEGGCKATDPVPVEKQLKDLAIHPGQDIKYVVVDDEKRSRDQVALAHEAIKSYNLWYYETELVRAVESLLSPLGWDRSEIRRELAETRMPELTAFANTE